MKIILASVGTRGDMEPFLALGNILQEKGHQVICAFPEQFRPLIEGSAIEFASLGEKFMELLESDDGKAAMGGGGSGMEKFLATLRLAKNQSEANKQLVHRQYELIQREKPDRIVYNGKATVPVIWEISNPGKATMVSPLPYMHYVRDHAHVAFNRNFGPFINKLTYGLADFGLVQTIKMSANWENMTPKISSKQIKAVLKSGKAIYTISPSLFARPTYWPENLQVLGYHQHDQPTDWQPDDALTEFLARHKGQSILLVTFGSMTNPKPTEKTNIVVDILQRNQIPAIINTASGGLIEPDGYDAELLHFVSQIPYDWILPQVYGVIHHGGSGTTHLALKYGCAVMIIPHIIDQFVWDTIIADLGVGPRGIKVNKITTNNLEPKLLELINNEAFKQKATQVASQMAQEDFREAVYQAIIAE
jgi:UDP:flavonoid glycosyltransferase YjiC (YdhE family)